MFGAYIQKWTITLTNGCMSTSLRSEAKMIGADSCMNCLQWSMYPNNQGSDWESWLQKLEKKFIHKSTEFLKQMWNRWSKWRRSWILLPLSLRLSAQGALYGNSSNLTGLPHFSPREFLVLLLKIFISAGEVSTWGGIPTLLAFSEDYVGMVE